MQHQITRTVKGLQKHSSELAAQNEEFRLEFESIVFHEWEYLR